MAHNDLRYKMSRLKANTNQFFNQIKTKNLDDKGRFIFEIDLNDDRIKKSGLLQLDNKDFIELQNKLPPSFIDFIKNYSDGLYIDIANALTIFPVGKQNDAIGWSTILGNTKEVIKYGFFSSKEFIFFAQTGVDSEMFAFYTGVKFNNGEYPIVWFTPGSTDTESFVLVNSSFDKFLTTHYYWLVFTAYYDYNEPIATLEENNKNGQNFIDKLYDTFDPNIPKPNYNFYEAAVSFEELKKQIENLKIGF